MGGRDITKGAKRGEEAGPEEVKVTVSMEPHENPH